MVPCFCCAVRSRSMLGCGKDWPPKHAQSHASGGAPTPPEAWHHGSPGKIAAPCDNMANDREFTSALVHDMLLRNLSANGKIRGILMRPIVGFSTGAVALGDFRRALLMMHGH